MCGSNLSPVEEQCRIAGLENEGNAATPSVHTALMVTLEGMYPPANLQDKPTSGYGTAYCGK